MSITLMTPSFRLGEASTVVLLPSGRVHGQVMPEPRCGMPGRSMMSHGAAGVQADDLTVGLRSRRGRAEPMA